MSNKIDFKESMMFAGVYISVVIGSGFATGQEIIQFFSSHGLMGIFGNIMCMVFMSYSGSKLMYVGSRVDKDTADDIFTFLGGKTIGLIFKVFMPIFLISTFVVMIAGAGASLNQYYSIPNLMGSAIMCGIALLSIFIGMEKLLNILGNIGPVIAIVAVFVGVVTLTNNIDGLATSTEAAKSFVASGDIQMSGYTWYLTGLVYTGFNLILAAPFITSAGSRAKDPKSVIWGGIFGGVIFSIATIALNLGILSDIENIALADIPTLFMAGEISPILGTLFSVMLVAGIYTTAVPLLWSFCNTFAAEKTKKFNTIAAVGAVVGLVGGSILPFDELVNLIYPASGVLGILIIVSLMVFKKERLDQFEVKKTA